MTVYLKQTQVVSISQVIIFILDFSLCKKDAFKQMTGLLKILASKRLYMDACWALSTQQHWPLRELVLRNLM